jgi:hypothetical protein
MLGLAPAPGAAQVSDGWQQVGRLEVRSQTAFAEDDLWRGTSRTVGVLLLLMIVAGAISFVGVNAIRAPLERTVEQARAIMERRFVTVAEPEVPELRNVTRAMNAMVGRVKAMFEEQAGQVEQLRRQAHCDPLTGVSNRAHYLDRLGGMLATRTGRRAARSSSCASSTCRRSTADSAARRPTTCCRTPPVRWSSPRAALRARRSGA